MTNPDQHNFAPYDPLPVGEAARRALELSNAFLCGSRVGKTISGARWFSARTEIPLGLLLGEDRESDSS